MNQTQFPDSDLQMTWAQANLIQVKINRSFRILTLHVQYMMPKALKFYFHVHKHGKHGKAETIAQTKSELKSN